MKKILMVLIAVAMMKVMAAMNDSIIAFSTPGIDRYADGSMVLNGESYALVWQRKGVQFAGFTADCCAVDVANTKILAVAPLAKDGKCPETIFEIDADLATTLSDGDLALYLLDTRITSTNLASYVNGRPAVINSIGGFAINAANGFCSVKGESINLAKVGVESQIENPVIVGIAIKDAKVILTVKGMSEAATYHVVPVNIPDTVQTPIESTRDGDTLTVPEGAGSLFRVIGIRKF